MGSLRSLSATDLGAVAIDSAVERAGLSLDTFDKVIMGNVISAGLGQAPARQAALKADFDTSIGANGGHTLVTLLHALHRTGGRRGVVSLCLGGGNAVAMVIQQ